MKRTFGLIIASLIATACGTAPSNTNTSNATNAVANAAPAATQTLTVVDMPQRVKDMMASRGEQDKAEPTLKIVEPAANATVNSSTVKLKLALSGDLKGYQPHKDEATQMGNHIHVILDNQPYEAYYNLAEEFELRNVADGEHTIRIFASRPWHESYKNVGAFQMVKFTVKNGTAESNKPATTNAGQQMSNANSNAAPREGKDMSNSTAGAVDATKPLLTYSRPKGEYKGVESDPIMIDFWLTNARFNDGLPVEHLDVPLVRVRYTVDGGTPQYIDKWAPLWLAGWTAGKHTIKLELVDADGGLVDNGGYNSTTREITVVK